MSFPIKYPVALFVSNSEIYIYRYGAGNVFYIFSCTQDISVGMEQAMSFTFSKDDFGRKKM